MIKNLIQLKRRKGFTLVECIVAIAVFALLAAVILMILVNAQTQAQKSRESEEDLNNLIENVVGDDTYKKYSSESSNTLTLYFNGSNEFNITYDTIAGYKNYVKCDPVDTSKTSCGYVGNNTEFMSGMTVAQFLSTNGKYKCPQCGEEVKQTLVCEGCLNEGNYYDTSKFICSSTTGSYSCLECGGGSVKGKGIDEAITADANFRVSGLTANSIRYGKVDFPEETKTLIQQKDSSNNIVDTTCTVTIEYEHKNDNLTLPGVYTMTFSGIDSSVSGLTFYLPPWYVIGSLKTPAGSSYTAVAHQTDLSKQNITGTVKPGLSSIEITPTTGSFMGNVTLSFTLTNYKNGYSFDYDYRQPYDEDGNGSVTGDEMQAHGLIGYWFRIGKNRSTPTYKHNSDGSITDIVIKDTVTVTYPDKFVS